MSISRLVRSVLNLISVFRKMLALLWQAQPLFCFYLIVLEIVQGILPLGLAWVVKSLFDVLALSLSEQTVPWPYLLSLLTMHIGLTLVSQLLQPLNVYLNAELGRQLSLSVQTTIYGKANSLAGLAAFEDPRFYNTINLASQGADFGPQQMLFNLSMLIRSTTTLLAFLAILVAFDPILVIMISLVTIPELYVQIRLGKQRFGLAIMNTPKERLASYYGSMQTGIQFAKEFRLLNLGEYFMKIWQDLVKELHKTQRNQQQRELRYQAALELLTGIVSAVAFIIVVLRAFSGMLTIGDVTLYVSAVATIQGALLSIVMVIAKLNESALFFSYYDDLMKLPQTIFISSSPRPVKRLTSGIKLQNVHFRYSSDQSWVLQDLNLNIPVGKCTALVGLNGSGKTTLAKLLTRMYDPIRGQILWDGVDIREFDPFKLRTHIGVIFQDFVHFDLSAFENIALGDVVKLQMGNYEANRINVEKAAKKVGIHNKLDALPQGYKTVLSRWIADDGQGIDLSGGEWQKVALARMLVRDTDLLILDEPTAALDPQAEYDIYSNFVDMISGRTSLVISHRFSTVRIADVIAVLERGEILEYGSHDELIALGGRYAQLYNMQAERYH